MITLLTVLKFDVIEISKYNLTIYFTSYPVIKWIEI